MGKDEPLRARLAPLFPFKSDSEAATFDFGVAVSRALRPGDVIGLCGDLGAGKTVFVRGVAAGLGVDRRQVTSPTFIIANEYSSNGLRLYHLDLYRVKSEDELAELGFEDYFARGGICMIEWAERSHGMLPAGSLVVNLGHCGPSCRVLEIA